VARDLGGGVVDALVLEEFGERGLGFAALARLFLLQAFGLDALVLFPLRTDRIGLGEVDFLARPGALRLAVCRLRAVRRPAMRRLRAMRRLAMRGLRTVRRFAVRGLAVRRLRTVRLRGGRVLSGGRRRRLEAEAEQLVAQGIAHGGLRSCVGRAKHAARRGRLHSPGVQ